MCDGEDNDCDGDVDETDGGSGDDVGDPLCEPGHRCEGGECIDLEPVDPPVDEESGEHGSPAGCGCASGGGAGGGLLLALGVLVAVRRRRSR
jgi:MYXO-CTERM domain-containing protein